MVIVILLVGATVSIWLLASSNIRREHQDNSQSEATHKSTADAAAKKGDAKAALKEYQLALDACSDSDATCQAEMKQRIHEMETAMKVKLDSKTNLPVKKWVKPPAPALPKSKQKSQ